ncbi:hypothetical protein EI94DRAFT_1701859 [Lactarius quietus]|nr:hypothetical protein EI94DRAFT_1701859 [Lactarius quietus]
MRLKHAWETTPEDWDCLGSLPAGTTIDLHVALKPYREDALIDALNEVSDPRHPNYTRTPDGREHCLHNWLLAARSAARVCADSDTDNALFFPTHAAANSRQSFRQGNIKLYSTYAYVPTATDRNKLAVAGYISHYPNPADLTTFMRKYRPDGIDATYTVERINGGGYDLTQPNIEPNVNIQTSQGMAYPTPHIVYSTAPTPNGEYYLPWLLSILRRRQPIVPQTITASYGVYDKLYPLDYVAHLSVRGVSIIFSSGDQGGGEGTAFPRWNDPVHSSLSRNLCQWSLGHGRWRNDRPDARGRSKLLRRRLLEHFLRPPYQEHAVPNFLQNLDKKCNGLFNPWAAIPDIAGCAGGENLYFLSNDEYDLKAQADRRPLSEPLALCGGLVGLTDITSGENEAVAPTAFLHLWWDPVTGLGTPDFDNCDIFLI